MPPSCDIHSISEPSPSNQPAGMSPPATAFPRRKPSRRPNHTQTSRLQSDRDNSVSNWRASFVGESRRGTCDFCLFISPPFRWSLRANYKSRDGILLGAVGPFPPFAQLVGMNALKWAWWRALGYIAGMPVHQALGWIHAHTVPQHTPIDSAAAHVHKHLLSPLLSQPSASCSADRH